MSSQESSFLGSSDDAIELDDHPTLMSMPRVEPPRKRKGTKVLVVALAAVLTTLSAVLISRAASAPHGWTQIFDEQFDTAVSEGQFPGTAYGQRWLSYDGFNDTSGLGTYAPSEVLSVHDGSLDMRLHTSPGGRPLGAAPIPLINGQWGGQVYGRFTIRFKTDSLPGYGAGWLLWPDSNNWAEGEIDFPEGALDGTMHANQHCIGDPEQKCLALNTEVPFSGGWHTTDIEWKPGGVRYFLDGTLVAESPESPSTPFHLVLQTATTGETPDPDTEGHVLIDSVTISSWT